MKEFNIEEYNELCADFMDTKYVHSDWNWIMEVFEKIEDSLGGLVVVDGKTCFMCVTIEYINYNNTTIVPYSKKEAAVQAIWHFLNWYKENEQYIKENKSWNTK